MILNIANSSLSLAQELLLSTSNALVSTTSSTQTSLNLQQTSEDSLLRTLGQAGLRIGHQLLRHEWAFNIRPWMERHRDIVRHRTPVTKLPNGIALKHWLDLQAHHGQTWVDIGSGNADTLSRLARSQTGTFIAVDKENSTPLRIEVGAGAKHLAAMPSNMRYLLLSWNQRERRTIRHSRLEHVRMSRDKTIHSFAEQAHRTTVETIGEESADVVSVIFPYTEPSKNKRIDRLLDGPQVQPLQYQIATAVHLLKSGGTGVLILESSAPSRQLDVLGRALHYLRASALIQNIAYAETGISTDALQIASYAPQANETPVDTKVSLDQGQLIFFTRKITSR